MHLRNVLTTHVTSHDFLIQGACTYDVWSEWEGEYWLNSDHMKGFCVDLVLTRGGRGSKIPGI